MKNLIKKINEKVIATIDATFNPEETNKEKLEAFIKKEISELKGVTLDSYDISNNGSVKMVVSIFKHILKLQSGEDSIEDIKEYICFLTSVFLEDNEDVPSVKIASVEVRFSL